MYDHMSSDFDIVVIIKSHNNYHTTADHLNDNTSQESTTVVPNELINVEKFHEN